MNRNKKTKRFFVLKNFKTHFIKPVALKTEGSEDEEKSDVIREAESIIDNYLKKMGYNGVCLRKNKKRKRGAAFGAVIAMGMIAAFFLILRFM